MQDDLRTVLCNHFDMKLLIIHYISKIRISLTTAVFWAAFQVLEYFPIKTLMIRLKIKVKYSLTLKPVFIPLLLSF